MLNWVFSKFYVFRVIKNQIIIQFGRESSSFPNKETNVNHCGRNLLTKTKDNILNDTKCI